MLGPPCNSYDSCSPGEEMGHIPTLSTAKGRLRINDRGKHTLTFHSDTEVRRSAKLVKPHFRRSTSGPSLWSAGQLCFPSSQSVSFMSGGRDSSGWQASPAAGGPGALSWPFTNAHNQNILLIPSSGFCCFADGFLDCTWNKIQSSHQPLQDPFWSVAFLTFWLHSAFSPSFTLLQRLLLAPQTSQAHSRRGLWTWRYPS